MNIAQRLIILLTPLIGPLWIASRRRTYRRRGRPLTQAETAALTPFFDAALLSRVRIAVVPRIETPLVGRAAARLGLGSRLDLSWVRGMAFRDTIAISGAEPSLSLLFHELVHVVQYRALGTPAFLRWYISDYFHTGSNYFQITAELDAYALQDRFNHAPKAPFSVLAEVKQSISRAMAAR